MENLAELVTATQQFEDEYESEKPPVDEANPAEPMDPLTPFTHASLESGEHEAARTTTRCN